MTPVACPRLFEAEAMRDGRLAGAALARFARHTTICRSCQREVQALEALAEALRARRPGDARVDELHRLRERTRLVAAFDNALVAPRRRSNAMRRALWPATAAIIASAIFLWRARSGPDVEPAPTVIVHAGAAAVWSKHAEEGHDKIVLERGDLWIRVDHARRQSALIVALPDGELEDTGTTFTVSAAGGRTTRVAVEEGSVLLRIHGRPPVAIGRAESWAPALPAPASPAPGRSEATGPPHRRTSDRAGGARASRVTGGAGGASVRGGSRARLSSRRRRARQRCQPRGGCCVRAFRREARARCEGGGRGLPPGHRASALRCRRRDEACGAGLPPAVPGWVPSRRDGEPDPLTRFRDPD